MRSLALIVVAASLAFSAAAEAQGGSKTVKIGKRSPCSTDEVPKTASGGDWACDTAGSSAYGADGSAGADSVYVDASGNVGIGTTSPIGDGLDVVASDDTFIRARCDGSTSCSSYVCVEDGESPAERWCMHIANTDAFFLIDNNGFRPLVFEDGSPTNAIYTDSSGDVCLGCDAPGAALEIDRASKPDLLFSENGVDRWYMEADWHFYLRHGGAGGTTVFQVYYGAPQSLRIDANGNLIALSGGVQPESVTADPCADMTEGSMFYNDTSDYMCYCSGASKTDLKVSDDTACF